MKKLYAIVLALFLLSTFSFAQDVVLINTDFSEINPPIPNHAQYNSGNYIDYGINFGLLRFIGPRYNDTSNRPTINSEDPALRDPATIADVRYLRVGTSATLTNGVPTNHFYQVKPNNPFVNGGKVTLTISVNGTGKGINVYDMGAPAVGEDPAVPGSLLGTIDISSIAVNSYVDVTFNLPTDFTGIKTLGFCRAEVDGAMGGVTFFTWNIKVETFKDTPNSIRQPLTNANLTNIEYYNITGSKMGSDWNILPTGIYIVKKTYDNGEVVTEKVSKARK